MPRPKNPTGGTSRDRRRQRRAASHAGVTAIVAAASGSSSLPLSSRAAAWSGPAAAQRVAKWASSDGSGDKDKIDFSKYGQAFAWKDSAGGDNIGDFKLGFADVVDGVLTAIWGGVTAAAGAVQGARGDAQARAASRSLFVCSMIRCATCAGTSSYRRKLIP